MEPKHERIKRERQEAGLPEEHCPVYGDLLEYQELLAKNAELKAALTGRTVSCVCGGAKRIADELKELKRLIEIIIRMRDSKTKMEALGSKMELYQAMYRKDGTE